jgi:hypothetical protein
MRVTLSIDDDILAAAKALARAQRRSIGAVISDLARRSLGLCDTAASRNGIPLLAAQGEPATVTLDDVNGLRDELP